MGSPRINYKDHERDIGKEFDETYRAKLKYAEPMYAMEKKYGVDGHGDVRCFIDEEEVDCNELQETEEEWVRMQTTGGGAET